MKKKLLLSVALLCAVAQGVQAKNAVHNLSTLACSGETIVVTGTDSVLISK